MMLRYQIFALKHLHHSVYIDVVPLIGRRYRILSRHFFWYSVFVDLFVKACTTFYILTNIFLFCYRQMAVRIVIDILKTVSTEDLLKELSDIMKVLTILVEGKILFPSRSIFLPGLNFKWRFSDYYVYRKDQNIFTLFVLLVDLI